jgi:hypothetical protein
MSLSRVWAFELVLVIFLFASLDLLDVFFRFSCFPSPAVIHFCFASIGACPDLSALLS